MGKERKSRITIPDRAHPLARFVFAEMRRQAVTYDTMEWKAGVLRTTVKAWRKANTPSLQSMEAALGVLGWNLLPIPDRRTIPAELRADLESVAAKYALDDLPVLQFIAACTDYGWRDTLRLRAEANASRETNPQPIAEAA